MSSTHAPFWDELGAIVHQCSFSAGPGWEAGHKWFPGYGHVRAILDEPFILACMLGWRSRANWRLGVAGSTGWPKCAARQEQFERSVASRLAVTPFCAREGASAVSLRPRLSLPAPFRPHVAATRLRFARTSSPTGRGGTCTRRLSNALGAHAIPYRFGARVERGGFEEAGCVSPFRPVISLKTREVFALAAARLQDVSTILRAFRSFARRGRPAAAAACFPQGVIETYIYPRPTSCTGGCR